MFQSRIFTSSLLALTLLAPVWGADKPSEPAVDINKPVKTVKAQPRDATSNGNATLSTSNYETFKNITIAAGQSASLDSTLDYSATDRVAITVRGVTGSDLSNVTLQPYWAVPNADSFSIVEYEIGTNFPYLNVGGAIFQVYGPQFRLVISNDGKTTVNLQQVTLFIRSL